MKYLLILVVVLSGCSIVEPKVVLKTEYVIRTAPAEMFKLDAPVVDADLSTQKGIAEWLVKSEARMNQCSDKLNALNIYFNKEQK